MSGFSKSGAVNAKSYASTRWTTQIGKYIPDSDQALNKTKHDWFEMAREDNLGPPTGMTTFVANPCHAAVKAHVLGGPCALPDAEDTVRALLDPKQAIPPMKHVAAQVIHYKRVRADFEAVSFKRRR